jgi:photosystem II stability/assembly factor-like uncharacterized protein
MKKNILLFSLIFLVAAGCDILGGNALLGVVKTVDGGGTWQGTNKIEGLKNASIAGLNVSGMAFDPSDHETIFLSSVNGGMWKSDNSGTTWKQILSKITIYDFFVDHNNTNRIFVVGIYDDHGKVLRTMDGGKSWEELYNEASVGNGVNSITANPSNTDELYAGLNSGVVVKSQDGGINWFVLSEFEDQIIKIRYDRINSGLYLLSRNKGLFRSSNNGLDWTDISSNIKKPDQGALSQVTNIQTFTRMALDDQFPKIIYVTASTGLYKSVDDGRTWIFINLPIKDTALKPRAIASSKGGVVAYTSIGNTVFKTLNGGQSWQTQLTPTAAQVNVLLIDPVFPQITYAGLLSR